MKTKTILLTAFFLAAVGSACQPPAEELFEDCADGEDNDNNGLTDCEDVACEEVSACSELSNCRDGIDNNLDGFLDCEDFECAIRDNICLQQLSAFCLNPEPLQLPADESVGNNVGGSSFLAGTCTGESGGFEILFEVESAENALIDITLTPDATDAPDLGLYVRSFCANPATEIACADNVGAGAPEVLTNVPITASGVLTIVVDGATAEDVGAFTLTITAK